VVFRNDKAPPACRYEVWLFEVVRSGAIIPREIWTAPTLDEARSLGPAGRVHLERSLGDPEHLVEVWV
jgi:hypothetical protein